MPIREVQSSARVGCRYAAPIASYRGHPRPGHPQKQAI